MTMTPTYPWPAAILSLALLEAGILFVNDIKLAFAANNLAIRATLFYGRSYFHKFYFKPGY